MAKRQRVSLEPPKTTMNTDALTGERLSFAGPRVSVPDNDRIYHSKHARTPQDLTPNSPYALGYRVALPYRLHQRQTEGTLGGNAFAGPLMKYCGFGERPVGAPVKGRGYRREPQTSTEYAERYWWTPTWAEAELRAHFPVDVVDAVLSVRRDGESWDAAMVGCPRALGDVKLLMRQMRDHCHAVLHEMSATAA